MQNYVVIFDKLKSRIGFVEKVRDIRPYISQAVVVFGMKIICILIIFLTIYIFCVGRHEFLGKNDSNKVFEMGSGIRIG